MTKREITYFIVSFCIFLGIIFLMSSMQGRTIIKKHDTTIVVVPRIRLDTTINVVGKTALFIGDSHTSNHNNGWQKIVCNKTGMKMKNVSVSGKTTYWMLEMGVYTIKQNINYCFIYGGANDMYTSSITPEEAVNNIQGIIRICVGNGVRPVVLTGFDPRNTNTPNKNYIPKYIKFQQLLLTTIKDATVIDTRVVLKSDCWDGLCHMAPSGHKKIAEKVISDMKLKVQ
jgi:lysophospholipase L1-like esterase